MRVCSYLVLVLCVSPAGCHTEEVNKPAAQPKLRFDGVYQAEGDRNYSRYLYLRFYPDGLLMTSSSDTPEQVATWFDRSRLRLHPYTQDGQRIAFATTATSPGNTRSTYEGEILDDALHVSWFRQFTIAGHVSTNEGSTTYLFVAFHGEPGPPPPLKAEEPNPPDGANKGVQIPLLRWRSGRTALFHDIYLGTRPDLGSEDQVAARQPISMFFYAPGLVSGTTYYWRVDEIEAYGTVHQGDVWSFTAE